jgi:Ni/Co efflux regulator RcnB
MHNKLIASTCVAALLATSTPSFAQNYDRQNDRQNHRGDVGNSQQGRDNRGQDRQGRDNRGHDQQGRDNRGHDRQDRADQAWQRANGAHDERGAGPRHDMRRGQRLSSEYRSRQYVVDDWRGHRLSAPPRGCHWVQTGGDYVLVAIATGLILQILLNN